jgi:(p)ppGpp synthase/HD superfamily hydrolase
VYPRTMTDEQGLVERAARLAARAHRLQERKADGSPYIVHPFMVAMALTRHGFPQPVIAAALVHDVLEDTDVPARELEARLGREVLDLVQAVTNEELPDWHEKKRRYIARVAGAPEGARAVAAADKIHNLQSLLAAWREQGPEVYRKFNKGMEDKLWFEREMLAMLRRTWSHPLVEEYGELLRTFEQTVTGPPP